MPKIRGKILLNFWHVDCIKIICMSKTVYKESKRYKKIKFTYEIVERNNYKLYDIFLTIGPCTEKIHNPIRYRERVNTIKEAMRYVQSKLKVLVKDPCKKAYKEPAIENLLWKDKVILSLGSEKDLEIWEFYLKDPTKN